MNRSSGFKIVVSILKVFVVHLFFFGLLVFSAVFPAGLVEAALNCSVTTSCPTGVTLFKMENTSNSHAELPTQSNYSWLVCCSGVIGLGNSCSGNFAVVAKLSSTSNAHIEQNDQSNYANNACISIINGTVSVDYEDNNCNGFDTTVASMAATTNSHVADGSVYPTKICASATVTQTLSFSISGNTIGFGDLSPGAATFATANLLGSQTEVEAHNLQASSNAASGYVIKVQGGTLRAGQFMITAVGGANTASTPGSEQFGLRMVASGGSGTVTVPYAASGFAYAGTASTSSQVASASSGDGVTTTYSVRYLANIAALTEAADYSTVLTYSITGNF